MDAREALHKAEELLRLAGVEGENVSDLQVSVFGRYAETVAYAVREMPAAEREKIPWLKEWALTWRRLKDSFDEVVASDPMVLYRPMNQVALEFHSSKAFIRYFRAGNRTSKTQSGYAEHYFAVTGQHPYRYNAPPPASTFVIGINFSKYHPNVFLKKLLTGEDDNYLSPMFPEGGKWFNRYDARTHSLWLACPDCAAKSKAGSCRHQKSTITLFSDGEGWEVLQGAQYRLGHFDEHVDESFFNEALQRTQALRHSGLIVTGTPLHGYEAWEYRRLSQIVSGPDDLNRMNPGDPTSHRLVSLHEVDQFAAGIVSAEKIRMSMATMDEFEIESRVYGRPAPLAKNPVFDRKTLAEMRKSAVPPTARGEILLALGEGLELGDLTYPSETDFLTKSTGPLRIWEYPSYGGQYIAAADTAAGLAPQTKSSRADASCCSILKILPQSDGKVMLRLVAQYHEWLNPLEYAEELKKLCVYYNRALCVIELTGGLGRAVMLKMRELNYENVFRDSTKPELVETEASARFGVETSAASKPMMVGALQQMVKRKLIHIPCEDTIQEMVAFEQERSPSGLNTRYRGAGGAHDDRVMSLVIGAYVAVSFPVFDFMQEMNTPEDIMRKDNDGWKTRQERMWDDINNEVKKTESPNPFA